MAKKQNTKIIGPIPPQVRRWYRKIGAMGGQAGRGTETRRELMRANAYKRWAKHRVAQAVEAKALKKIFTPEVAAK